MRLRLFMLLFTLITGLSASSQPVTQKYDICIYGGTSAGIVAAYTAQKQGKSVVMIVPDGHLGGLSTGGLGQTDIGNKQAIGGYSREFYTRLGQYYGAPEAWKFEPKAAAAIFKDMMAEVNIKVIYDKRISSVTKSGTTITTANLVNTYGTPRNTQQIQASVFIDCTYEGDLLNLAGISYTVGRESNSTYNELNNGFQLPEYFKVSGLHQFPDGVDPYKQQGNPASGLVWGISDNSPSPTGTGDKLVQAYNFRICLTDSASNMKPIRRPKGFKRSRYELLTRLIKAQPGLRRINDYFMWSPMPGRKTDINNRGGFSTDMIGANHDWPEASFDERRKIFKEHLNYTKGLLYFFKTDKSVPDTLRRFVGRWGYPKDEYRDHNNFTPQLYVREGRRMIGEYVMTEDDCNGKKVITDPIGMAAYKMDSHNTQRIVVNGMVKNEGNVEVGKFPPYPISYRSITPKRSECTNLLVPIAVSSSHIAFGSLRMEPVFMVLGQSAAAAAVQAINEKKSVQEINYNTLKTQLLKDKQVLGL
ncbi:MAG TPA: FAD-dependent oxidoreductase [Sphingobacteriaceae bacterium]